MNHAKTILPALLGLLVLFWTGDKIGYRIRADMEAGVSGLDMADRFWLDLLDPSHISTHPTDMLCVFCQVVIGQCGVSFPSEKAVGFSPVRNWPVIA
ncbi:MAG: hypothetical protein E7H84_10090, partial [Bifidobacterium breve]|nr:hypothetical protein [Bifidobacterium breve]